MYFLLLFTFHLNAFRNDIHYSWLMCYFHPQLTQILVQIWKIYLVRPCPQAIPSCRMRCRQDPWRIGNAGYVRFHVRVIAWRQHRFLNRHKTQQQRSPQSQWSHLKWKKNAKKKKISHKSEFISEVFHPDQKSPSGLLASISEASQACVSVGPIRRRVFYSSVHISMYVM